MTEHCSITLLNQKQKMNKKCLIIGICLYSIAIYAIGFAPKNNKIEKYKNIQADDYIEHYLG